jgi:hypothetical protein
MRDAWSMPPRSWLQTVLVSGLTAIRLAIIAVLVLFVLGPMLLDFAKVRRGSPAVNFMYDGRTYVRQTAGAAIAKYIPTKFAGKDRHARLAPNSQPACARARKPFNPLILRSDACLWPRWRNRRLRFCVSEGSGNSGSRGEIFGGF